MDGFMSIAGSALERAKAYQAQVEQEEGALAELRAGLEAQFRAAADDFGKTVDQKVDAVTGHLSHEFGQKIVAEVHGKVQPALDEIGAVYLRIAAKYKEQGVDVDAARLEAKATALNNKIKEECEPLVAQGNAWKGSEVTAFNGQLEEFAAQVKDRLKRLADAKADLEIKNLYAQGETGLADYAKGRLEAMNRDLANALNGDVGDDVRDENGNMQIHGKRAADASILKIRAATFTQTAEA